MKSSLWDWTEASSRSSKEETWKRSKGSIDVENVTRFRSGFRWGVLSFFEILSELFNVVLLYINGSLKESIHFTCGKFQDTSSRTTLIRFCHKDSWPNVCVIRPWIRGQDWMCSLWWFWIFYNILKPIIRPRYRIWVSYLNCKRWSHGNLKLR